jgi:FAD/FMN-containing dehydrogenase
MTLHNTLDRTSLGAARALPDARPSRFGAAGAAEFAGGAGVWVNDVHAQLNRTHVTALCQPSSPAAVQRIVRRANDEGTAISIAGGRHAMGGQQFGGDTVLIDTTRLDRVLAFDPEEGTVKVEAGIQWPKLIPEVIDLQKDAPLQWGIRQKQTGADRLSLGGALAANAHGRGLSFKPLIDDIESVLLVDPEGELRRCSRTENRELFRLAVDSCGAASSLATGRSIPAPPYRPASASSAGRTGSACFTSAIRTPPRPSRSIPGTTSRPPARSIGRTAISSALTSTTITSCSTGSSAPPRRPAR